MGILRMGISVPLAQQGVLNAIPVGVSRPAVEGLILAAIQAAITGNKAMAALLMAALMGTG
jgi:hypothetical protein